MGSRVPLMCLPGSTNEMCITQNSVDSFDLNPLDGESNIRHSSGSETGPSV